ncbi:DUF4406 domain-containing protein [Patescibacteria group bacterium]|nr:DUF4406 domain-containing protein [Patescibacteria group bacterium]MBU4000088.1 DUF4406 domain-containing protein [Patescibacteria group bacterium]MBU4056664.1 DUF4406 domain-containing protein [Patescibacteria group bacterium]MBU4368149.1 DUF4406 domain-containing protein [Patescibacteria group bacterium]
MKNKNTKKVVFIGHPISGDIRSNVKKVLDICKKIHNRQIIPCVPYLVSIQYLGDEITEDRELGIDVNLECFYRRYIDELWLFGDRISKGMEQEINLALKLDVPIIPKTNETKKQFKELKR